MARPTFRDQDVLGLAEKEGQALIAVLLVRAGLVTGSREFFVRELPVDGDLLGAFLKQYYTEGRPLPDEMLLPGDVPDRRLLEALFRRREGRQSCPAGGPGGREGAAAGPGRGQCPGRAQAPPPGPGARGSPTRPARPA